MPGARQGDLNTAWKCLLPASIRIVAGRIRTDAPPLTRLECSSAGVVTSDRLRELTTGRYYAKHAMSLLGLDGIQLPVGPDRAPVWPAKVVGSITHARNSLNDHCAVAVGLATEFCSIGIDAEIDTALEPDVWRTFLTDRELKLINSVDAANRGREALNRWCVKEAITKARAGSSDPTYLETEETASSDLWRNCRQTDYVAMFGSNRWLVRTARVAGFVLAAATVTQAER